jgi:RNA recognition motif-containing protein
LNSADTKVIRRGRRSLGYGFVDFVNEDDAKKAVEAMDHKDLDGRALNVELAKPREDEPADQTPLKPTPLPTPTLLLKTVMTSLPNVVAEGN